MLSIQSHVISKCIFVLSSLTCSCFLKNNYLITFQVNPNSDYSWGINHGLTGNRRHTQQVPSAWELFHTIRCSLLQRKCQHGGETWELLHKKWAKHHVLALLTPTLHQLYTLKDVSRRCTPTVLLCERRSTSADGLDAQTQGSSFSSRS